MAEAKAVAARDEVTLARLEDQIRWYSRKSRANRVRFKALKTTTIVSAALIPALTLAKLPYWDQVVAGLGVLIAIVEGLQQLNQYHSNWTAYRASSEALKHEKFLYLAGAGPYRTGSDALATLAENDDLPHHAQTARMRSGT